MRLPGADHGYFPPGEAGMRACCPQQAPASLRDALNSFGQLAVDRWVGPAVARRVQPEPFVNALDRWWCAQDVGLLHRALDRLDRLSPTAIEQCDSGGDALLRAWRVRQRERRWRPVCARERAPGCRETLLAYHPDYRIDLAAMGGRRPSCASQLLIPCCSEVKAGIAIFRGNIPALDLTLVTTQRCTLRRARSFRSGWLNTDVHASAHASCPVQEACPVARFS